MSITTIICFVAFLLCATYCFTFVDSISVRTEAPKFTAKAVLDDKFITVSSDDYRGKWMVLLFYPFDYTFVCPTEIISFSEKNKEFLEINTQVLAISTDSHHTHLR